LNVAKSHAVHFIKPMKDSLIVAGYIICNGLPIAIVTSAKFLGIKLYNKLNGDAHI
jgi:hypothetical protein